MRMLLHNIHPDVAKDRENLEPYRTGHAVRSWECLEPTVKCLLNLETDETLLMQSGAPATVFKTFKHSPAVFITNSNIVPKWATYEYFRKLEAEGLITYGQMTAGSWIYIGTQGILQGTYGTIMEFARQNGWADLKGKVLLSAGLGAMSGAQPLAATFANGVGIIAEVREDRIDRAIAKGYCDAKAKSVDEAIKLAKQAAAEGRPLSIGLLGNAADVYPEMLKRVKKSEIHIDMVTEQTAAHDPLRGYTPAGITAADGDRLRWITSRMRSLVMEAEKKLGKEVKTDGTPLEILGSEAGTACDWLVKRQNSVVLALLEPADTNNPKVEAELKTAGFDVAELKRLAASKYAQLSVRDLRAPALLKKLSQTIEQDYIERAKASMRAEVEVMAEFKKMGITTFDYGNFIRVRAEEAGLDAAIAQSFPGFVAGAIRPMFCEGLGPFRWVALSGNEEDIRKIDRKILKVFTGDKYAQLRNWIEKAGKGVQFQGLPSRICWFDVKDRARMGKIVNDMVASGELSGPIAIGRDHLDTGSVASPQRETEGMLDGSDAISDWVFLNLMLSTAGGANWVSLHHGGGVGIGNSQHAGLVIVADGTKDAAKRMGVVLKNDSAIGVVRHASAGYPIAIEAARKNGLPLPMAGIKITPLH